MKELDLEQVKVEIPEIPSAVVLETTAQKCKALICFGWQKRFTFYFLLTVERSNWITAVSRLLIVQADRHGCLSVLILRRDLWC